MLCTASGERCGVDEHASTSSTTQANSTKANAHLPPNDPHARLIVLRVDNTVIVADWSSLPRRSDLVLLLSAAESSLTASTTSRA